MAEQAVLAKSRFLAAASHDLRQPFQAMRLFLHLLLGIQEVVVRARGLSVDGSQELVADGETTLGAGAISVDYAGRA